MRAPCCVQEVASCGKELQQDAICKASQVNNETTDPIHCGDHHLKEVVPQDGVLPIGIAKYDKDGINTHCSCLFETGLVCFV